MSSSKKPVTLFLTRLTPAIWAQFYSWYEHRKEDHRPVCPPSSHGIWVTLDEPAQVDLPGGPTITGPRLVAGCCIYPADGPYAVAEFVSTNPFLPARLVHAAVERICFAMNLYGAMVGKTPLCFPKHKGVKRLMRKFGYNPVKPEVEVMWSPYFVAVGTHETNPKEQNGKDAGPGERDSVGDRGREEGALPG